jgi:predicted kinase
MPWIVFTAGPMGAGKSHTMKKLVKEGRFPLLAFVRVDPDAIRQYLPEFHLYVQRSPELAGELTMKEAGYIAEILTLAGLEAGKNVLVDGSLRRASWYREHFARLRKDFNHLGLRIAIIHVTAPREAVFQRAAVRMQSFWEAPLCRFEMFVI